MAGAQKSGLSSNTSSRNRNPAWACSCARSAWPGPAPRSAWPILPTISPVMSGTRGELRPHDGESGRKRRRDAEIGDQHQPPASDTEAAAARQVLRDLIAALRSPKIPVVRGVLVYCRSAVWRPRNERHRIAVLA